MVVDDDEDIRDIITVILESEGYKVCGLNNGGAVARAVSAERPDLVLLDVQLGDSDGRDICRNLKQQAETKDIPILMISASHGWPALEEKQCNADDFLAKPFEISELIAHVRRYAA